MRRLLELSLVLSLVTACACGGRASDESTSPESAPQRGGTAVIGFPTDFDALNELVNETAHTNEFLSYVLFQNLVRYEGSDSIVGVLADSFGVADDGLSATFRIRDGVRWHDGEPFTVEDVVWSFETSVDEETAYPNRTDLQYVERAERVDDRRVRFHFSSVHTTPIADFAYWAPMPRHLLEDVPRAELRTAAFNRNPVGNGPFRFISWQPNQQLVFEANEEFYAGRPHLDRIVVRIVPERTTLITELLTGNVDLVAGVPPVEVEKIESSARAELLAHPATTHAFVMYQTRDSRLDDPRVRRALTMAIDRETLVEALLHGYGEVSNGPFTPVHWAHADGLEPLPHDPERARELLAEAGWRDTDGDGWLDREGRPLRLEMITNQDNNLRRSSLVVIQDQLEEIGVDVQPRGREFNVLVGDLTGGTFEAILIGFVWSLRPDPSSLLFADAQFNGGSYANPVADSLARQALRTLDREEARPLWEEYQRIVQEDQPMTWLFVQDALWGVSRRMRDVSSITPTQYGILGSVSEWWIPESAR